MTDNKKPTRNSTRTLQLIPYLIREWPVEVKLWATDLVVACDVLDPLHKRVNKPNDKILPSSCLLNQSMQTLN